MRFQVYGRGIVDLPSDSVQATSDLAAFHRLLMKEGRMQGLAIKRSDLFQVPEQYSSTEDLADLDRSNSKAIMIDELTKFDRTSVAFTALVGGGLAASLTKTAGNDDPSGEVISHAPKRVSRREQVKRFAKGLGVLGGVALLGAKLPSEAEAADSHVICYSCAGGGGCNTYGCCGCSFPNYRTVYVYECYDTVVGQCVGDYCGSYSQFCG